jgi:AraC family transcriptional regulator
MTGMSRHRDEPFAFSPLHDSSVVSIREYRCHACRGGPTGEEQADANSIVLMRRRARFDARRNQHEYE